jgi:hypothetical protein
MKRIVLAWLLFHVAAVCAADDPGPAAGTPSAATAQPTPSADDPQPAAPTPGAIVLVPPPATPRADGPQPAPGAIAPEPAKFTADAEWQIAGYNNEEIIYTILVTNEDSRIIRCNAELQGYYIENGKKVPIADRQSSTIFPGKKANVGHWMGMDQKSGATYSVKCRPI